MTYFVDDIKEACKGAGIYVGHIPALLILNGLDYPFFAKLSISGKFTQFRVIDTEFMPPIEY